MVLLVYQDDREIERFAIELETVLPLYSMASNDKIATPTELEKALGEALTKLYTMPVKTHQGETFKLLVQTQREEALAAHSHFDRDAFQLVRLAESEPTAHESVLVEGIGRAGWTYTH